jgi:hypothetical protein
VSIDVKSGDLLQEVDNRATVQWTTGCLVSFPNP